MNKPTTRLFRPLQWLTAVALSVLLSACGGGSSTPFEDGDQQPSGEQNLWSFGAFDYEADTNFQTRDEANHISLRINDRGMVDQGLYTGALLEITLTDTGSAIYSLTDQANFERDAINGVSALHLMLTVGLADPTTGIATFSSSAGAGSAEVTVNADGQYFVTIEEPVILSRSSATSQFDTETPQLPLTTLNIFGELPIAVPAE